MEKRLNQKIEEYISTFKNDIREAFIKNNVINDVKYKNILQYICDYETLVFEKDDFKKRKRVKNFVPTCERCIAKRANGEQCTRRKKTDLDFCGTHEKDTPFGIICDNNLSQNTNTCKVEVWSQDIQGIIYYIDKFNNVYDNADILNNKINPKIIAKYNKIDDNYTIINVNNTL